MLGLSGLIARLALLNVPAKQVLQPACVVPSWAWKVHGHPQPGAAEQLLVLVSDLASKQRALALVELTDVARPGVAQAWISSQMLMQAMRAVERRRGLLQGRSAAWWLQSRSGQSAGQARSFGCPIR